MATKGKTAHPLKVGAGELLDASRYAGQDTEGEFFQPFWDEELYDKEGNPIGQDGPVFPPNPWDKVQLGDYVLPGIWSATATPLLQLDIQKPKGFDGAALISRGYKPGGITLTGLIWTPFQWRRWQEVFPGIWTRPFKVSAQAVVLGKGGKVSAEQKDQGQIVGTQRSLEVVHPGLNQIGITALVIERVAPPVPWSQPGVRQIVLQCVEYVSPPSKAKSAVSKVDGQKSRGQNAFDKQIEARDAKSPKKPSQDKKTVEP